MTPDPGPSEWSEPTISQPTDETPDPGPVFSSVPFSPVPVASPPRMKYEEGAVASWHPQLIDRAADVGVAAMPIPLRVLDVGCGAGRLLAELIVRVPHADVYIGVDPVSDVVSAAQRAAEPRLTIVRAAAEALPFPDASFDLVMATLSFAYWVDQRAGLEELARVVADHGKVVVVESTKSTSNRRNRARSVQDITDLLDAAGLRLERTETVRRSVLLRPIARAFISSL